MFSSNKYITTYLGYTSNSYDIRVIFARNNIIHLYIEIARLVISKYHSVIHYISKVFSSVTSTHEINAK